MRSHTFSVSWTSDSATQPTYRDLSAIGTPLEGVAADTPVLVNVASDAAVGPVNGGGDGVLTARVSATDTIRLRAKALASGSYDVLVTVFD